MKKWGKKEIMEHLDSFITEDFECDHISVTFPNDNMVRIELTNDSEALIRCKDCTFLHDEGNGEYGCTIHDDLYVSADDWFCADGKRKEGDGE